MVFASIDIVQAYTSRLKLEVVAMALDMVQYMLITLQNLKIAVNLHCKTSR
jgi:hypothetical protein